MDMFSFVDALNVTLPPCDEGCFRFFADVVILMFLASFAAALYSSLLRIERRTGEILFLQTVQSANYQIDKTERKKEKDNNGVVSDTELPPPRRSLARRAAIAKKKEEEEPSSPPVKGIYFPRKEVVVTPPPPPLEEIENNNIPPPLVL